MTVLAMQPTAIGRNERVFFVGMALVIILIDAVGFSLHFLKTEMAKELHSDWVKVHVFFFTSWIIVFFVQSLLIASGHNNLHRNFGLFGIFTAFGMVAITVGGAVSEFVKSPPRPALDSFMLGVVTHVDAINFAILAIAGIIYRKIDKSIHMRLLFLATVVVGARFPMLGRATRLDIPHWVDQDVFVLAGIAWDAMTQRRLNPAYIWGGILIAVTPPLAQWSFGVLVPHLVVKPLG
jgi:hypothetical protein